MRTTASAKATTTTTADCEHPHAQRPPEERRAHTDVVAGQRGRMVAQRRGQRIEQGLARERGIGRSSSSATHSPNTSRQLRRRGQQQEPRRRRRRRRVRRLGWRRRRGHVKGPQQARSPRMLIGRKGRGVLHPVAVAPNQDGGIDGPEASNHAHTHTHTHTHSPSDSNATHQARQTATHRCAGTRLPGTHSANSLFMSGPIERRRLPLALSHSASVLGGGLTGATAFLLAAAPPPPPVPAAAAAESPPPLSAPDAASAAAGGT